MVPRGLGRSEASAGGYRGSQPSHHQADWLFRQSRIAFLRRTRGMFAERVGGWRLAAASSSAIFIEVPIRMTWSGI